MKRRNGINYNTYTFTKPKHMEDTISSYCKQRDKYINYSKEIAKLYLDIFVVNKKIEY